MAKKPQTVRDYLDALPPERRDALETLRKVFHANLDAGIKEGIQYGMIGYFIPHERYPAGYHCDPAQPLPFAGLASQKQHLSMYLMGCYPDGPWKERFVKAWKASGKKLDMGAACVRFTSIEQVPLEVVAQSLRDMSVDAYIAQYEAAVRPPSKKPAGSSSSRTKATGRKSGVAKTAASKAPAKSPRENVARSKASSKPPSRRTRS